MPSFKQRSGMPPGAFSRNWARMIAIPFRRYGVQVTHFRHSEIAVSLTVGPSATREAAGRWASLPHRGFDQRDCDLLNGHDVNGSPNASKYPPFT